MQIRSSKRREQTAHFWRDRWEVNPSVFILDEYSGQPIIHRWSCAPESDEDGSTSTSTEYCLTVHTCTIDDGHGNEQKLLDYNG